MMMSRKKYSGK